VAGFGGGGRRGGDAVRGVSGSPSRIVWGVGLLARVARRLRAERRSMFEAYDDVNNSFNLAYTMLKWRVNRAILGAKLEPYLWFVHSEQRGKPSLVCDLMELYRCLVDDFPIGFFKKAGKRGFIIKGERTTRKRRDKRECLNKSKTGELVRGLDGMFGERVEVPRIRYGSSQALETLINEEALLLAKYLRGERKTWIPRVTFNARVHNLRARELNLSIKVKNNSLMV